MAKGRAAHIARLKRLSGAGLDRAVGAALIAGAQKIQVTAQIGITTGSASGTKTNKHKHTPSRPGEYPNQFTGVLGNNIETALKLDDTEGPVAEVSSNAPYSAALEYGTSRMAARPFMAPSRDAERENVQKLVVNAIKSLVKRSGR